VLRLVLDTNTVLSGLLWGGTPAQLITAARGKEIALYCSPALLVELRGVIHREKFAKGLATRGLQAEDLFNGYAALCQLVAPRAIARTSIDPDDDQVLSAALAARAHLIVSGDRKHLLVLKQFEGIPIVTAAQAIAMIEGT
jgi:putative PIN family toxin of toxin-antitoxin system